MATDPICGMYVDERTSELRLYRDNRAYYFCGSGCLAAFQDPRRELVRLRLQLALGAVATAAILLLTYAIHPTGGDWILAALGTAVQIGLGAPFYRGTWDAVRSRTGNMDVLIAVGTTAAYAYSLAVVVAPGRLPPSLYFDASAAILTLILAGNYLERQVRGRASSVIDRLRELLPAQAHVLQGATELDRPVDSLQPGERVRVRPGERFPADGTVVQGQSEVSEALLTGEAVPRPVAPGSRILAGSVNGTGSLDVDATTVGEDTFLAHIGELVSDAELNRVPLQQLADRIAGAFVPFVLSLALVAATAWALLGHADAPTTVLIFVAVVITACPCAFGLATPAALVVGTGRAAEEGILFRGQDAFERAAGAQVVLTDKTGTLTRGAPELIGLWPTAGVSEFQLLEAAAAVEAGSEHPLAQAVRTAARARGITPAEGVRSTTEPGRGVRGSWNGRALEVCRPEAGPEVERIPDPLREVADRLGWEGASWSIVRQDGQVMGLLAFSDEPAPSAAAAIRALQADGLEVVMVTGDGPEAAQRIANAVGIRDVRSRALPEDKLRFVREFQTQGRKVAFVGDGINDAAALSAADVGIAIGSGSDVAKDAGQILLLRSDPRGIPLALRIARRTVDKVRQNLTWALGYNAILLPIAAGALVFAFGFGVYQSLPFVGAIAMAISSTLVVTNSLSLGWIRIGDGIPQSVPGKE
ncbi:MAG: heavy metal translocating P-type ATPase [Thermoplasmata archaeon]|nr:heavy metal translocating P-type ATPase [Thermoplasmata archaeon]